MEWGAPQTFPFLISLQAFAGLYVSVSFFMFSCFSLLVGIWCLSCCILVADDDGFAFDLELDGTGQLKFVQDLGYVFKAGYGSAEDL